MRLALALTLVLAAAPVRAEGLDDAQKEACADAYDTSQVLRDDGALMLARAQLLVCRRACPAALAADCERWQSEIEARLPTVRLVARDESGRPVEAKVRIDASPLAALPREPVFLEPGAHRFVFEREDGSRLTLERDLVEGDPSVVEAVFVSPGQEDEAEVGAVVLMSVGGAALIVGGALAIAGHVDRGALFDCRPTCAEAEVEAVATKWTAAGITAGVGGAVAAAGLLWWLVVEETAPESAFTPRGIALRF